MKTFILLIGISTAACGMEGDFVVEKPLAGGVAARKKETPEEYRTRVEAGRQRSLEYARRIGCVVHDRMERDELRAIIETRQKEEAEELKKRKALNATLLREEKRREEEIRKTIRGQKEYAKRLRERAKGSRKP